MIPVTVVVVHYRSRGDVIALCADLAAQDHRNMRVVLVECGDDGSVQPATAALGDRDYEVLRPGANLGYCGGNNFALASLGRPDSDVLIVNPDVRLDEASTIREMQIVLHNRPDLAAVGPLVHTPAGSIEHCSSKIDRKRGLAVHTRTNLASWPPDLSAELHLVPWLSGCCWLWRQDAYALIGGFDERFFLYCEEVDWAWRATDHGLRLGIIPGVSVTHRRSSSFQGTEKGAYYFWRNNYLLFRKHLGLGSWVVYWAARLVRFCVAGRHRRSGASRNAMRGFVDAVAGSYGPKKEDRGG